MPHGNQRLSDSQVTRLRRRYRRGSVTLQQLSTEYGITPSYASRLARGVERTGPLVPPRKRDTCARALR
jgi:hypothetical protein